ncbi:hypothetical protein BASA81_003294 [Batrachochytrium salamandrivorans]|nr:hypothetical protein BASA81_003294 [Batrachochytrium salamandrivorans]
MSLVLYQFRPAYDVLAYLALCGNPLVKCQVENLPYPTLQACTAEPLPCIRHQGKFVPKSLVFDFLSREFADLDAGLGLEVKAESQAFSSMLLVELEWCLEVIRYVDEEHWWNSTYPELVGNLSAPFGRLVARKMRRDALRRMQIGNNGKQTIKLALEKAKKCYLALANRLGEHKWLLNTPGASTVDALLFGHLCQARSEPLLGDLLRTNEDLANLEVFYKQTLNRVRQSKFFSHSKPLFNGPDLEIVVLPFPTQYARLEAEESKVEANKAEDVTTAWDKSQTGGLIQAATFAIGTLLAYMMWNEMLIIQDVDE